MMGGSLKSWKVFKSKHSCQYLWIAENGNYGHAVSSIDSNWESSPGILYTNKVVHWIYSANWILFNEHIHCILHVYVAL